MRDSWLKLVGRVLRPARPRLERCLEERERHLDGRRRFEEERARAIASATMRIEAERAAVFAAGDGVVTSRMTHLEREWRTLSRSDPDAGLMDLWASIAPSSWIDRKRWRDGDPATRLDIAIALAADVEGIEAAEAAIRGLRAALAEWALPIGSRVRWRWFELDVDGTSELLAKPLRAACEALSSSDAKAVILERAHRLERDVQEEALGRFPGRVMLARALAHAAFVDFVWRAAAISGRANPVTPLFELWSAGYALSALDELGVTVELPPL
jgi:hypothetical protein